MATYIQLRNLQDDDTLRNRTEAAIVIAAANALGGVPTPDEQRYAAAVFSGPTGEARKALMFVLAENSSATEAQIKAASDATLQTNVNDVYTALQVAWLASNP